MHDGKIEQLLVDQADGICVEEEELRLRIIAKSYADNECCIAVLTNLRTKNSHIYIGKTGEMLGFGKAGDYQVVDSLFEDEIYCRIPDEEFSIRNLEELAFLRFIQTTTSAKEGYPYYMATNVHMADNNGVLHNVLHRIYYFGSEAKHGLCYGLCLYNFTAEKHQRARIINKVTGEERAIEVSDLHGLLTEREKEVLLFIQKGMPSKEIADRMAISKHTIDRHRQNIIAKLQVNNCTEAIFKAKELGLIK